MEQGSIMIPGTMDTIMPVPGPGVLAWVTIPGVAGRWGMVLAAAGYILVSALAAAGAAGVVVGGVPGFTGRLMRGTVTGTMAFMGTIVTARGIHM